MSKLYFEMNDKEKQLNLIAGNLDYAYCIFSEGLGGTGEFNLDNSEVNRLQRRIAENLSKASENIYTLLKAVEEKEIEEDIEEDIEEPEQEEESLTLHLVENVRDLSVLNDCRVEHIIESTDEEKRKGIVILLKKRDVSGIDKYIQLLFSGDGNKYMSDEF